MRQSKRKQGKTEIFLILVCLFLLTNCAALGKELKRTFLYGPGGIKVDKYSCIGVMDFEGEGGKEVAIALASAMGKIETAREKHLKVKYIALARSSTKSKTKVKIFKGSDNMPRYKMRKLQNFENSRDRFERRAMQEALKQGHYHGVEAIITGKMIFNDVMDLYIEKAKYVEIMRDVRVKFHTILVNTATGRIEGKAYDVWNKGHLFANRRIEKKEFSLFQYGVEQLIERKLLKGLSTAAMGLGLVYDYLKDEFEPPDLMIKEARESVVDALIGGIIRGTNY